MQSDYTDYVACLELNGQGVLRMPVFLPVPPELRGDYIDSVKEKLRSFSSKGYLYNEVWWQHVGCRKKTDDLLELTLLDLGSLEVTDAPPMALSILKSRCYVSVSQRSLLPSRLRVCARFGSSKELDYSGAIMIE